MLNAHNAYGLMTIFPGIKSGLTKSLINCSTKSYATITMTIFYSKAEPNRLSVVAAAVAVVFVQISFSFFLRTKPKPSTNSKS